MTYQFSTISKLTWPIPPKLAALAMAIFLLLGALLNGGRQFVQQVTQLLTLLVRWVTVCSKKGGRINASILCKMPNQKGNEGC